MRLSPGNRFCFVHIPKTGGTSIARVIDQQIPRWALTRDGKSMAPWEKRLRRLLGRSIAGKHEHLIDIYNRFPRAKNYFSFGVVRSPHDWLISFYNFMAFGDVNPDNGRPWQHELKPLVSAMSFSDFVDWVILEDGLNQLTERRRSSFRNKSPVLQRDWLSDHEGRLIVDRVIRFEEINSSFPQLAHELGLRVAALPHFNEGTAQIDSSYYTPSMSDRVAAYFETDIRTFGYS